MKEKISLFFQEMGYQMVPSNLPEYTAFYLIEHHFVNIIHVVEDRPGIYLSNDQYEHMKTQIVQSFQQSGYGNIHILSLIISDNMEYAKTISKTDSFCWAILPTAKRLVIYENQIADFYGMRSQIENWLDRYDELPEVEPEQGTKNEYKKKKKISYKELPWATIVLVAMNVFIFIICTFTGDLLYNEGALGIQYLLDKGEFYRIFTAMFLHADTSHLFNNMIILYFVGEMVERNLGRIKYLILYFIAGIGSGVASVGFQYIRGTTVSSIGASGAIFGVIGALLLIVIVHKGRVQQVTMQRLSFMILFSLYVGFTSEHIDNAAHVGGLMTGFLVATVFYLIKIIRNNGISEI